MSKIKTWMIAAILSLCGANVITSCDIDNSDITADNYQQQFQGSHWRLGEVLDHNGVWQNVESVPDFDIPDLYLGNDGRYEMKMYNYDGSQYVNTFRGSYSIDHGMISLYDGYASGVLAQMSVRRVDGLLFEASLTIYGNEKIYYYTDADAMTSTANVTHHTVRLRRIN